MGTKNNPGKFDCYEKAEPDEPMFILLGRDKFAGHLTSIWAKLRVGDWEAATAVFDDMVQRHVLENCITPDIEKASEAMDCAFSMFKFREAREANKLAADLAATKDVQP